MVSSYISIELLYLMIRHSHIYTCDQANTTLQDGELWRQIRWSHYNIEAYPLIKYVETGKTMESGGRFENAINIAMHVVQRKHFCEIF